MTYFDNASTTWPKPDCVYTETERFCRNGAVNANRGQYRIATQAQDILKETREQIKRLLKCNSNYETVFTASATEALNVILQGMSYEKIQTVYTTHFEHNAVLRTLSYLQKIHDFAIIYLEMSKDKLGYDLSAVEKQFEEQSPDLLVMTHASNVCGLITPIGEICELSRPYRPKIVIDMAQTASLLDTDVTAMGASAAVFAGHKTLYAPFGVSGFVIKKDVELKPLIYGGTGWKSADTAMPDCLPERFEAGSRNIQAIAGLYHALGWIKEVGVSEIRQKEQELKDELISLLSRYKNIHLVGDNPGIGIVSCVFDGYAPDSIGYVLDSKFDIAVRTGLHCSPKAHEFLGTAPAGTVRFSLGYFNSPNDLEYLDKALDYISKHG